MRAANEKRTVNTHTHTGRKGKRWREHVLSSRDDLLQKQQQASATATVQRAIGVTPDEVRVGDNHTSKKKGWQVVGNKANSKKKKDDAEKEAVKSSKETMASNRERAATNLG